MGNCSGSQTGCDWMLVHETTLAGFGVVVSRCACNYGTGNRVTLNDILLFNGCLGRRHTHCPDQSGHTQTKRHSAFVDCFHSLPNPSSITTYNMVF